MLQALVFIFCVAVSAAETPVITTGNCVHIVPDLNTNLDLVLGVEFYELYRNNDGDDRTQYCGNVIISRANSTHVMWDELRFDAISRTVLPNPIVCTTGCKGLYASTSLLSGVEYTSKVLLCEDDLFVIYVCEDLGNDLRADRVYVFGRTKMISCGIKERVDAVLAKYGVTNKLVATVQDIPECSLLRNSV